MRKMWSILVGLCGAGVALMATPLQAAVLVYQCQIDTRSGKGWIPEVVIVAHDPAAKTVLVSDPIIFEFNDRKPLEAKVTVQNDRRLSFTWRFERFRAPTGQFVSSFVYRGTYVKARNRMVVSAKPLGYVDNLRGEGPCQVSQG